MSVKYKSMLITPAIAEDMLSHNIENNRNISKDTVDKYARDMLTGKWELDNPTPITLWDDGRLVDGQHRLRAIIKSGIPIRMTVATAPVGVSEFDSQRQRTENDYLTMKHGYNLNDSLKSAIKLELRARRGNRTNLKPSREEVHMAYMQDKDTWDEALNIVRRGTNHALCLRRSTLLAAKSALKANVKAEELKNFFLAVNTGYSSTPGETAAITARNHILSLQKPNGSKGNGSISDLELEGIFEEYIYLYMKGCDRKRPIKTATWRYSNLGVTEAE